MYEISNGEGKFSISHDGNITIASSLDHETTSGYNLTVIATDGMHTDIEYIQVIVNDINDVVPQFTQV